MSIFNKRTWLGREGVGLNHYLIDGVDKELINNPTLVTQEGDQLSPTNFNDLETRISNSFNNIANATYIIDSQSKFDDFVNQVTGNDYTYVYIVNNGSAYNFSSTSSVDKDFSNTYLLQGIRNPIINMEVPGSLSNPSYLSFDVSHTIIKDITFNNTLVASRLFLMNIRFLDNVKLTGPGRTSFLGIKDSNADGMILTGYTDGTLLGTPIMYASGSSGVVLDTTNSANSVELTDFYFKYPYTAYTHLLISCCINQNSNIFNSMIPTQVIYNGLRCASASNKNYELPLCNDDSYWLIKPTSNNITWYYAKGYLTRVMGVYGFNLNRH